MVNSFSNSGSSATRGTGRGRGRPPSGGTDRGRGRVPNRGGLPHRGGTKLFSSRATSSPANVVRSLPRRSSLNATTPTTRDLLRSLTSEVRNRMRSSSISSNQSITSNVANATQSNSPGASGTTSTSTTLKRSPSTTTLATSQSTPSKKPAMPDSKLNVRRQSASAPAYGGEWISVSVGPKDSPTPFMVHKELASKESAFIEAALRHEWKESEEKVIHLPNHDPEHFKLFFLWIYNRVIFSANQGQKGPEATYDSEWNLLAGAWALGAYLQAPDFGDAVVDAIVEKANAGTACTQTMHEVLYPISQAGAPIRKLLVHIASRRWGAITLKTMKNDPSWSDFFYDLSVAVLEQHQPYNPAITPLLPGNACAFHEHSGEGLACYKSKHA